MSTELEWIQARPRRLSAGLLTEPPPPPLPVPEERGRVLLDILRHLEIDIAFSFISNYPNP